MNFKLVQSYDNYINANMQLQQLEAHGIKAYLQNENTVTIAPQFSNAVGGIKLMVNELQWKEAVAVLESLENEYRRSIACPKCGEKTIERELKMSNPTNWITALFTWIISGYGVATEHQYRCSSCGHIMKELPSMENTDENNPA